MWNLTKYTFWVVASANHEDGTPPVLFCAPFESLSDAKQAVREDIGDTWAGIPTCEDDLAVEFSEDADGVVDGFTSIETATTYSIRKYEL